MPVRECTDNGQPGFQWGDGGKCYTYPADSPAGKRRARQQAINQGYAAGARGDELIKAMGEGAGSGAALVPSGYVCPRCGRPLNVTGKAGMCPNCGWQGPVKLADPVKFQADFDIKSVSVDEKGTLVLEGYANTWQEDRDHETTARDAFDASLTEYMENPVLLYGHDRNKVLGSTKWASTDNVGLYVIAEVPKPVPESEAWHHKAYSDIKRGVVKSFSMGGIFYRSKDVSGLIYKVDLYEISVVPIPANPASMFSVAAVKGFAGFQPFDAKSPHAGQYGRGAGLDGPRARHQHANGVNHRHRGGMVSHKHRKDAEGDEAIVVLDLNDGEDGWDQEAEAEMMALGDRAAPFKAYALEGLQPAAEWDDYSPEEMYWLNAKREYSQSLREQYARQGIAMPDGGYPIPDGGALEDAIQAFGRAKNQAAVKRHIIKRARALGLVAKLPEGWVSKATEPTYKEAVMANEGTPGTKAGGDGGNGDFVQISKKDWDEHQTLVQTLAKEHDEREKQAQAEKLARERIEAEQKAAKAADEQKAARQKEIDAMVEAKVLELRKGISSGTKMRYGAAPEMEGVAGMGRAKGDKIVDFMNALIRAKHGDPEAHKYLVENDAKAAAAYGLKAYNEGASGAGGFLVPPQFLQEGIAEFRIAQAKVRQLVTRVPNINSNSVLIPRETGISSVGWTAENVAKPSTDATFGQITVGIYTLAGIAKVSRQLLEDSSPAVDAIVRRDLGKALGQAEDIAMINGTGTGQPTGILNTAGVLTGAVGTKLWSSIAGGVASVQSNYFGNPSAILAHPRDVNTLRTTTDTNGRPIFLPNYWQGGGPAAGGPNAFLSGGPDADMNQGPTFQNSQPDGFVFGMPVYSDANIPTNLGAGVNETRMIIAAWDEAWVLDRTGMNMDVSSEAGTSFEQNQVWFRVEERVGFTAARQPSAFYVMTGLTPGAGL